MKLWRYYAITMNGAGGIRLSVGRLCRITLRNLDMLLMWYADTLSRYLLLRKIFRTQSHVGAQSVMTPCSPSRRRGVGSELARRAGSRRAQEARGRMTTRPLTFDICRCWSRNCEKRNDCARWTYRTDSEPRTPHVDQFCGSFRIGYISASEYQKGKAP